VWGSPGAQAPGTIGSEAPPGGYTAGFRIWGIGPRRSAPSDAAERLATSQALPRRISGQNSIIIPLVDWDRFGASAAANLLERERAD